MRLNLKTLFDEARELRKPRVHTPARAPARAPARQRTEQPCAVVRAFSAKVGRRSPRIVTTRAWCAPLEA